MYTDDQLLNYKVPKKAGGCFAMLQRVLHEGGEGGGGHQVYFEVRRDI